MTNARGQVSRDADQLMMQYSPDTRALIAAARLALRSAFPGADETADQKARLLCYAYGPGYKGTVATLILSKSAVKIGIPYGADLADPSHLLAGAGKVHRHIAIDSTPQLHAPAVKKLLKATLAAWRARNAT
jgi:hypothetical protein